MEFGIFQDGELLEGDKYSIEEATKAVEARYSEENGITIEAICPDHPDYSKDGCEECDSEDE